jgi:hypothetical protein
VFRGDRDNETGPLPWGEQGGTTGRRRLDPPEVEHTGLNVMCNTERRVALRARRAGRLLRDFDLARHDKHEVLPHGPSAPAELKLRLTERLCAQGAEQGNLRKRRRGSGRRSGDTGGSDRGAYCAWNSGWCWLRGSSPASTGDHKSECGQEQDGGCGKCRVWEGNAMPWAWRDGRRSICERERSRRCESGQRAGLGHGSKSLIFNLLRHCGRPRGNQLIDRQDER